MTATRCTCIGTFVRGVWVVEVADPACEATHAAEYEITDGLGNVVKRLAVNEEDR